MLRAISALKRSNSIFTQQTLGSLGTKLRPQAPKTETISADTSKKKKKIKLIEQDYVPPHKDEAGEYFRSIKNYDIKLPEVLLPVEKEWNTARQYLNSRTEEMNKYAEKMLEPGPRGLHWEAIEDHPEHMSSNEIRAWIRQHTSQLSLERAESGNGDGEEEGEGEEGEEETLADEVSGNVFANEYFNILKEYDIKKDLSKYPGSTLGPNMEDDPSYWAEWYVKNQPRPLKYFEQFGMIGGLYIDQEEEKDSSMNHMDIIESFMTTHYKPYEYIMNHPDENFISKPSSPSKICTTSVLEDEEYLPAPKDLPMNHIEFTRTLERWNIFPAMEIALKYRKKFDRGEKIEATGKPWKPISYSSCLNYYEMLPRYYRDHRLVVSVALTLDRCRPLMSRKNKEIFLNKLCNFLTPRDESKYKFLQEYFIKKETLNIDNPQVDYDPAFDSDTEEFKKSLIEEWERMFLDSDEDLDTVAADIANEENQEGEEKKQAAQAAQATPAAEKKEEKKKFPAKDKQNRVKKEKQKKEEVVAAAPKAPEEGGEEDEEDYGEYVRDPLEPPEESEDEDEDEIDRDTDNKKPKKGEEKKKAPTEAETKKKKFADVESSVTESEEDESLGNGMDAMFRDKETDVTRLTSIERENMVDFGNEKQVVRDPCELIPLPKKKKELEKIQAMSKEERELMSMLGETIQEKKQRYITYDWEIPDYGVKWFDRDHENPDGVIPSVITYYDNKDGYWDEWIKEKHERIGLPHMTRRCFLKH